VGVSKDFPNFSSTPTLSQERVKLRNSNLAGMFTGSIRAKARLKFGEKGAWAYPGTSQILEYPVLSQESVKLRTSNLVGVFRASIRTKAP